MLPRTVAGGVLAALAFVAGGADGADDPAPALRAEVDALVKLLAGRSLDSGPSPTERVHRLLEAGEPRLRPVLEETWFVVTAHAATEPYRGPAKRLIRFLFSFADADAPIPPGEAAISEEDGAVRILRTLPRDDSGAPSGLAGRSPDDAGVRFAYLVRGGRLRSLPRLDLKRAFAAIDDVKLADDERASVAEAIGEACAETRQSLRELARRLEAQPANPWLLTAFAWTGAAAAEAPIRAQIDLATKGRLDGGFALLCRALEHVRRPALVDQIGRMASPARDAALAAAGLDVATSVDLAAIASAPDAKAKRAIVSTIVRRIGAARAKDPAAGRTLAAIAGILVSSLDSADDLLRKEILGAAEAFFHGDSVGVPCPDMAETLASMAKDLASGDLVFDGVDASIFDLATRVERGERMPLLTDARCPDPNLVELAADQRATVKIRGVLVNQWLRLSLTNTGAAPITVNPVALRYATAEFSKQDLYGGPGGDRQYAKLAVRLGSAGAGAVTSSDRLVKIEPAESYSWTVTVPPDFHDAEHVSVELADGFAVRGKPVAPPLTWFLETWVK